MREAVLFFVLCGGLLTGCTNDHEEDLIEQGPIATTITYEQHVRPIISNNCISCHSDPPVNGATISLVNYNSVKNAVLNSQLIERIQSTEPGFRMPLGGPSLPQNMIELIVQWETDGLLEN